MNTSSHRIFLNFLIVAVLAVLAAGVYQRVINPSLTQALNVPSSERGAMPQGAAEEGQQRPPMPLPQADGAELAALMARLKEMPTNLDILLEISGIFTRNKDWPNALGFLRRAAELAPADMRPPYFLGITLAAKGDFADAAAAFEKALLLSPGNAAASFNLAIMYRHYLNQPDKGKELLQAIIASKDADEAIKDRARQELERK